MLIMNGGRTAELANIAKGINMNSLHVKGDWNIAKGKLKQKYAQLTENDLQYREGCEDELVGRIQKRTGDTKEAVQQFVDECFKS